MRAIVVLQNKPEMQVGASLYLEIIKQLVDLSFKQFKIMSHFNTGFS